MSRQPVSFALEIKLQSEGEALEDTELSDESEGESEDAGVTPKYWNKGAGKALNKAEGSKIIMQTAFDAYFTYNNL